MNPHLARLLGALALAVTHLGPALAQAPAAAPTTPIPVADFFRHPNFSQVTLSPNGEFLAAAVRTNGRRNLAVVEIKTGNTRVITNLQARDIASFRWLNNQRLVYGLMNLQAGLADQDWGQGLFAIDRDGSNFRELYALRGTSDTGTGMLRSGRAIGAVPDSDDVIVVAPVRSSRALDVQRLNTRTGAKQFLVDQRPGDVIEWVLDQQQVPRAALADLSDERRKFGLFVRDSEQAPWRQVADCDLYDPARSDCIYPVSFDADGSLLVVARNGADKSALYRWDMAAGRLGEKLVGHKDYDIDGGLGLSRDDSNTAGGYLVFDGKSKKLVGVRIEGEQLEQVWFDPEWARIQTTIDAALPGRTNRLSRNSATDKVLVFSYSERDPGRWYLLDPVKKQLMELVARMPWLKPDQMSPTRFVRYPARDGLSIPAYLTLPRDAPAKNLPLVVLVHGGPYVRGETWGFNAESQFLASRGYAVLRADYRGSMGYGQKHYQAGWKQWGRAMQDDLSDGIAHLAQQGIVDPSRVCIMGGSYGGYATMMGLAKDPDQYRCGVDIVGVTDLPMMIEQTWSDTNAIPRYSQGFFDNRIGRLSDSTEKAQLEANSPARLAARIKAPVMIAHGGGDARVPIQHATKMRSALRDHGREPEWLYYPDEGHGFLLEETRFDLYQAIEKFLAKNLQPR